MRRSMFCQACSPTVTGCVFTGNSAAYGGVLHVFNAAVTITSCTLSHNWTNTHGGAIYCYGQTTVTLQNSILAFTTAGDVIVCESMSSASLTCCDVYGNERGDWVGEIAGQLGFNGNFSADPLFCDAANEDLHISCLSPCEEGNHPDGYSCGLIGALGTGCGLYPTEQTTWGTLKALYRQDATEP